MPTHDPEHWKQRFNADVFRVPQWIADKYPSASWGNDICPTFMLPKDKHLLFVQAYKQEDRECGGSRFFIAFDDGTCSLVCSIKKEGDAAEESLKKYLAENYK